MRRMRERRNEGREEGGKDRVRKVGGGRLVGAVSRKWVGEKEGRKEDKRDGGQTGGRADGRELGGGGGREDGR